MPIIFGVQPPDRYCDPIYGLAGLYTLSKETALPYFATLLPLERVVDELKTAEELAPSLDNAWSLAELFQREIDRDRIEKGLVRGYLADPNKLKFFNALTVALMPRRADGQPVAKFSDTPDGNPQIPFVSTDQDDAQFASDPSKIVNFGGIQYVSLGDSARLRWNKDTVQAVAVDGQHRLVALKVYREKIRKGTFTVEERATRVPVVFLLLDEKAGLKCSAGKTIKNLAREIFTDLNKNARKVEKARELILDDLSIVARCVRTLVTNETAKDSNVELPLTLVRWQDSSNRFDQEYYLNSLVHIESLVDIVLDVTEPRDPMDEDRVEEFIKSVNDALVDGGELTDAGGRTLSQAYRDECIGDDGEPFAPFNRLPGAFLEAAEGQFRARYKPWIIQLLTKHAPYAAFLGYARSNDLIEGDFGKYYSQTIHHRNALRTEQGEDWFANHIRQFAEKLNEMKENDWSFKAIFQKAMVRLGKIVAIDGRGQDPKLGSINDYLQFLDAMHGGGLFEIDRELKGHQYGLWAFIAVNPVGGRIKVAKSVEDRLLEVLRLWYYTFRARQLKDTDGFTPKRTLQYFEAEIRSTEWPDCAQGVASLLRVFDSKVLHGDEPDDKKRRESQRERLAAVVEACIAACGS